MGTGVCVRKEKKKGFVSKSEVGGSLSFGGNLWTISGKDSIILRSLLAKYEYSFIWEKNTISQLD